MRKTIYAGLACLLLSACAQYIAPPFTNVMQISQMRPKMKLKQVVDVLGVEPYDIYHVQQSGAMIATFNYRLKKRIMKMNTLNRDEIVRETTNEASQTAGDLYYDKDYKTLHVMFDTNGDMTSYITSEGVDNGVLLVVTDNTIKYADEKDVTLLDPAMNGQVIRLKKQENRVKRERQSIFSRFFGIFYRD
jgi:hypothetical protein